MSPSSLLQKAGARVLLLSSGETLSVGPVEVQGTVNRNPTKIKDGVSLIDGGKPDFTILGLTSIEVMKCDLVSIAAGENFVDEFGVRHSIQYVTQTDISWVCYCQPTVIP